VNIDGIEILTIQPDFAQPPRLTGRRGISYFGRGQSRRFGMFPTGGVRHVLAHRYAFDSRTAARELEDFFNARRGQQGGFFAPGWHAELEPKQTVEEGGTELAIGQVNYAAVYLDTAKKARTGHYIYLLNEAGDFHATKVLSATTGATEVLTLRDAVPEGMTFQLGRYHVGFLYHARFMADALALEFAGPQFVTCETSMIELLDGAAPTDDEVTPADDSGPEGGENAEAGNSGNHYWLRVECPILSASIYNPALPSNRCPSSAAAELTLPSAIGAARPVTIQIRGVAETKNHTGGAADSPFYIGGTPAKGGQNILKLTVGSAVYYLNNALTGIGGNGVAALDYSRTVNMQAGDVIRLEYDSVDSLEFHNGGTYSGATWTKDGTTLTIADIPPGTTGFNGQFVQVDFTL